MGNLVTCGTEPLAPFATTVLITFELDVMMALELANVEFPLEYGGGAGVATGFAVFGVGRPTLGFLRYGFP